MEAENLSETPKESLLGILGLEEGWKNWLHVPQPPDSTEDNTVKNEPHEEVVTISMEDCSSKPEISKENSGENSNEESGEKNELKEDETTQEEMEYEKIFVKDYSTTVVKEEPVDDLCDMFQESILHYEKMNFHQKIFNKILEDASETSSELLQKLYISRLREAVEIEIFRCTTCQYETIHQANLKSHFLIMHNNEKMESGLFQCRTCSYTCKREKCMLKHVLNHQELLSDDNRDNDYYPSDSETKKVRKKIKQEKKVPVRKNYCDLCEFKSENPKAIIKHKNSHRDPENRKFFLCYKCPYENKNKWKLKKHLLNEHKVITADLDKLKRLKCEFCDYKTDLRNSLQVHMLKHKAPEDIELFYCDLCDFKTKYKINLKSHMLIHRPDEVTKKFMCEICSTRFRTRSKLKIHLLTHKSIDEVDRVFKCGECDYQTKSKSNLKTHMEIHQEPMYQCDVCGLQSRRKYNHDRHLLSHKTPEQVEMHRCSACPYQTKFKAYLKGHMKKKHSGTQMKTKARLRLENHKGPIFICNTCGLQSIRKWNYEKHLLTHKSPEEIPMIKCYICNYETKFKDYLKTHLKKIHNIITPSEKKQGPGTKTGKCKKRKLPQLNEYDQCFSLQNNILSVPQ